MWLRTQHPNENNIARHQLTATPVLLKCQPARAPKIDLLLCLLLKIRDLLIEILRLLVIEICWLLTIQDTLIKQKV